MSNHTRPHFLIKAFFFSALFVCFAVGTAHATVSSITVIVGANGSGTQDANLTADGIINSADAGSGGGDTLSTGALQAVAAGTNISITVTTSITFNDLGGTLTLGQGLGRSVSFAANTGAITFANTTNALATSGANVSFTAGTNLALGNLSSANIGDVSLTAGTASAGNLAVQSIAADSSGNIVLQATNAAGGTITQTGIASGALFNATGTGAVTVDSVRAPVVALTSNTASVSSLSANALQSSSQLTLKAATGITVNSLTPNVTASNSTSGNISITQSVSPAQVLNVNSGGVVNNAAGGTIAITNLGEGINANATVKTNNGGIALAGNDLNLSAAVNSGAGRTTLANSIAGTQIDLGTNTPGKLSLIQADLNQVTAGVLQIGSPTAGNINVTASITNPAGWNVLTLVNNSDISEAAAGSLTVPNLRVSSSGFVGLFSNSIGVVAANATGGFNLSQSNGVIVGVVDGTTGVTSANNPISFQVTNLDIQQPISAGPNIVTLTSFFPNTPINLGGADGVNTLGLTDVELGRVTAGVLRIGAFIGSGGISISSAITRHAGYNALSLSNSGPGTITQTAAVSVANLSVAATTVTLTNAGNDVDTLAAATANCSYTDANDLTIDTVDGQPESHANNDMVIVTGGTLTINQPLTSLNTRITLNAGGLVTEGIGGRIVAPNLQLLGTGQYNLGGSPTNDVTTIAANVTNGLVYIDANNLTVGTVNGTSGITAGKAVFLTTVAGDLTVNQNISSAAGGVSLTAGSTAASPDHILANVAVITGPGAALAADRMNLQGSVNVGAGIATLRVATSNRSLNLDNTAGDPNGELRLSQTELNTITAGTLRIGDSVNTGGFIVKSAIASPAGWNTLSLITAGTIGELGGSLTVPNLRVTSVFSVMMGGANNVGVLAGNNVASFAFNNGSNPLIVGVVDGITGVTNTGLGIQLSADNIDIQQAINAGANTVALMPGTNSTQVNLGGADAVGTLGLTDAELDRVTADRLLIQTFASSSITVTAPISQAGSGYNTLELNHATGASTASGGGSLAVNNLIFTDNSGAARTYNVNNATSGANAYKEGASAAIPYSTTTSLTINASTGNDIFNVTPSATTTFRVNGNLPNTAPGDTLNIDTTGTTITQFNRSNPGGASHDGNYMFSNRQPVFFTNIETLTAPGGPTAAASRVAGTIVDSDGKPVEGVVIRMSGNQDRKTITDANGNYHFDDVATNGFYSVTPARANYVFSPGSRAFSQLTDHTDAAFGASFTGDAFNPLDTPEYFVRQQYVDILGREPDEGGFNYWSDQILACGGDAVCNSRQRASVAAAFFIEQEFQQTGQFIYDAYSGSLGRRPAFGEYVNDRQQVIGGPNLDAEKASFMQNFVQRAEFVQKYSDATTADSFVDALLLTVQPNSGVDLGSQRDALIARYQEGVDINQSRSLVLSDIASSSTFKQAQYNRAFVLTEYFGYLQRDIDQGGYDFWLNVVNDRSPNNYRGMVCAFVTSAEYQKRFSTHVTHTNAECATVSEPKAVDANSVNSTKTRSH
jgi:Domain of unknown function (DUF4214)